MKLPSHADHAAKHKKKTPMGKNAARDEERKVSKGERRERKTGRDEGDYGG